MIIWKKRIKDFSCNSSDNQRLYLASTSSMTEFNELDQTAPEGRISRCLNANKIFVRTKIQMITNIMAKTANAIQFI